MLRSFKLVKIDLLMTNDIDLKYEETNNRWKT